MHHGEHVNAFRIAFDALCVKMSAKEAMALGSFMLTCTAQRHSINTQFLNAYKLGSATEINNGKRTSLPGTIHGFIWIGVRKHSSSRH
jgi:hypothetical protein